MCIKIDEHSYASLSNHLKGNIYFKRHRKHRKGVVFHQDNVPVNFAVVITVIDDLTLN